MFWVAIVWAIDISIRPYLIKVILNRLSSVENQNIYFHVGTPVILYLAMYLLMASTFRLYGYFVEIKMIPNLRASIAESSLSALMNKNYIYYQDNYSGKLSNKFNDLASSVPDILQIAIDRFFSHTLALLFAIFTLWQVNIFFALIMMVWASLFIIWALLYSKRLTWLADNWSEQGSIIVGKVVDIISNILSVRLFAAELYEVKCFNNTLQKAVRAEQKLQWSYFWMWCCYGYSFFALQILNFYLLIKGRQEGWITIGDFALVLILNISIIDFLWQATKDFSQFSKLLGRTAQALKSVLDPFEAKDVTNAVDLRILGGQITFDKVHFNYIDTESFFSSKSVVIESGQKVGLVGHSGSGKTTFINLILRLYDIKSGSILIDNQNIYDITLSSLYNAIAMIPQDPVIFDRTIMENIHYGSLEATEEEVIIAAKKAHADEFISKLPQGYQSLVGERGVKLSGGQRQRIAIARAILKNAPILILDEATSQLDSVTEQLIQESLSNLMQSKTTIIIAHRLSTLLHMDRILVFEQGKVVEDGSHNELLKKKGLYRTLWDAQVGGFLPDSEQLSDNLG